MADELAVTAEADDDATVLKRAGYPEHAAVLVAGAMLLRLGLWALGEIDLGPGDVADLAARGVDELGHLLQLAGLS